MLKRIDERITGRSRLALMVVILLLAALATQGLRHAWQQERDRTFSKLDMVAELGAEWLRERLEDPSTQSCMDAGAPTSCDAWLAELALPSPLSIAVFNEDLVLLGRSPSAPTFVGQVVADPFLVGAIVEGSAPPRTRLRTPLDGSERFFVTRAVAGRPIHVVVGTPARQAMAPWRAALAVHLLAFLLLGFLSGHLFRRHQHLRQAREVSEGVTLQLNALNRKLVEEVDEQRGTAFLLEQNLRDAEFLSRISRALVATAEGEAQEARRAALRETVSYFQVDAASLLVMGESQQDLLAFELVAQGPLATEVEASASHISNAISGALPMIRRHIQERRLFHVPDTTQESAPWPEERATLRDLGVRGVLLVRLVTRQGTLGLLSLQRFHQPLQVSAEVREFAEVVGDQFSEAVGRMLGTQRAQESERRFRTLFDSSNAVPIQGLDAQGIVRFWSAASANLYGISSAEMIGRPLADLLATPVDRERLRFWLAAAERAAPNAPVRSQLTYRRPDGQIVRVLSQHVTVRPPGHSAEFYCVDTDLSPRLALQELLREQATTDELTGLPNRREFLVQARREVLRARRMGTPVGLLMADLDHFKALNDRYGHQAGDEALRTVARTFRTVLRGSDVLARMGGEEFAILLPLTDAEAALQTAERLRETLEGTEVPIGEERVSLRVSIGVAYRAAAAAAAQTEASGPASAESDSDEEGLDTLLAAADRALYAAKRAGRNCCRSEAVGGGADD